MLLHVFISGNVVIQISLIRILGTLNKVQIYHSTLHLLVVKDALAESVVRIKNKLLKIRDELKG